MRGGVGFLIIFFGMGSIVLRVLILSVVKGRVLDEDCIFLGKLKFVNYYVVLGGWVWNNLRSRLLDVLVDMVVVSNRVLVKIDFDEVEELIEWILSWENDRVFKYSLNEGGYGEESLRLEIRYCGYY